MIDLNTASFLLSLLAILISFYTLYVERIIIDIKSIDPGINGVEKDKEWKHLISGIQVEVRNKGKRDAQNCKGSVHFKKMESLTLYPTEKGNVLDEAEKFNILAGERKHLVAAWNFSGTADGSTGFDKGTFLEKAPPITVVIYYGEKQIRRSLSEKDIEKLMRRYEEEHING